MNNISIGKRISMLMLVSGVLLLLIAGIGWRNESHAVAALKTVYQNRVAPLRDMARIGELLGDNTTELLLVVQHDPKGPLVAAHDHPVDIHLENFNKRRAEITTLWDKYMATALTSEEKRLATDFGAKRKVWVERAAGLMERIKGGDYSPELIREMLAARKQHSVAAIEALGALTAYQEQVARELYEQELANHNTGTLLFVLIIVGGMAGAGGFAWFLIRAITTPINTSADIPEAIASGDLTRLVPKGGSDEAGRLLAAFARMQDGLRGMVGASQKSAQELARAAEDLKAAAHQSANASEAQSEAASGMAAAVEEMSVSIDQVRDHARDARNVAASAGEESRAGGEVVHSSAEEMRQVATAVNVAAGTIRELENYSNEISTVVNVIREVADQTNLLALNAAIEAARAGEQGRGFAVVADEVRKLAERTSNSTTDITSTVAQIRQVTDAAVGSMKHAVNEVEQGIGKINESVSGLTRITGTSQEVSDMSRHIADAAHEQAIASEEVADNMEKIAGLIDSNLAAAHEAKEASDALKATAQELRHVVGQFKVI